MAKLFLVLAACVLTATAAQWRLIATNVLTTDLGVAFVNEQVGYTAGDANGVGPAILKSTDGGHNFQQCNATFGIDVLLLDCDAAVNTAVVSSVFGELYSDNDGKTFQRSIGGGTSQSVRFIGINGDGGHKYGVTGQYGRKQGVGISVNGGKTFTSYDANLFTLARYGAFPTDTTWYVAAGSWPDNAASFTGSKARHFRHRKTEYLNMDGTYNVQRVTTPSNDPGYLAQISKTTDGGKTWTTVFAENNTFYFNGIDCAPTNADVCCAVGESSGSTDGGARIYCTSNGGQTWNRTFWAPNTPNLHFSLLELRFSNDTDIWAVGGQLTAITPNGWFVHSSDAGQTWTADPNLLRGNYALGISMVNPEVGYAAVDNVITQQAGIAKYGGI